MSTIQNIFVLVLENRSFDHMLGLSGITGTDAVTGAPTSINGIDPGNLPTNSFNGQSYPVIMGAPNAMSIDPGHEIENVVNQVGLRNSSGVYPMNGFVQDFGSSLTTAWSDEADAPTAALPSIMACYTPAQLPVLNQLANEFCVCDNYRSSIPGATWPNRFFVHAATAGGIFTSPNSSQMMSWIYTDGIQFENGTIFDALSAKFGSDADWKIYMDESGPILGTVAQVRSLEGISWYNQHDLDDFADDLANGYNYAYTFIEPGYGNASSDFTDGSSQHPMDVVTSGEALIKQVYETIRNSPVWNQSMLIITYDEHGGFYDHVSPVPITPPGDKSVPFSTNDPYPNQGLTFNFATSGLRVPAVIISPWIQKNIIDHTMYDHSSIPATLEQNFGLAALTARDANANNFMHLVGSTQRTDCPTTLSNPADPSVFPPTPPGVTAAVTSSLDPIKTGHHIGLLHLLAKAEKEMSAPELHEGIRRKAESMKTVGELIAYAKEIREKELALRKTLNNKK